MCVFFVGSGVEVGTDFLDEFSSDKSSADAEEESTESQKRWIWQKLMDKLKARLGDSSLELALPEQQQLHQAVTALMSQQDADVTAQTEVDDSTQAPAQPSDDVIHNQSNEDMSVEEREVVVGSGDDHNDVTTSLFVTEVMTEMAGGTCKHQI